jgi:hypothetical protein
MSLRSVWSSRAVAAVALLIGAAAPAKADFVLDDFSTPGVFYQISQLNSNPYSLSTSLGTNSALGVAVTRTATVDVIAGLSPGAALGTIGHNSSTGVNGFEVSTAAASTATARATYSFSAPANLTATGVSAVSLGFLFSDQNVPYSFVVKDSHGNSATVSGSATAGPGNYTTNLSAFTAANPAIDLTSVTGFDIALNENLATNASTTSADFVLGSVSIVQPNAVPAPPAILLAVAALPALGLRRVFRKAA